MKTSQNRYGKLLFLTLSAGTMLLSMQAANAISLKENSLIQADNITLGDVFYDLPGNGDRVLGAAPRPGQEITLNSRTLLRIALVMDLPWRPSSVSDKVVLKRDATIIEKGNIEDRLIDELSQNGISGNFTINLPETNQKIVLPADQPATFEISKMDIMPDGKKFTAVIVAPSSANAIQTVHMSGQIQPLIEVPVVKANVSNGHTITMEDIEMSNIREVDFTPDVVADANSLVGMTARRLIVAGRPIKATDIVAQRIIERGSLVVLSLNSGALNLTTEGKALQNGTKGEIIRVLNTSSNQTVQGLVVAENLVSVVQN